MIIEKPWGSEEILYQDHHFVTKRLTINPGHRTSLQYHEEKTECIFVVSGVLVVSNDKGPVYTKFLHSGQHITLAPSEVHRLSNGSFYHELVLLECSTNHLDDVIRLEDDYGREEKT